MHYILRAVISIVGLGIPSVILAIRWSVWKRVKRITPGNSLSRQRMLNTSVSSIVTGTLAVVSIPFAFFSNSMLWNILNMATLPALQVGMLYYIVLRHYTESETFSLKFGGEGSSNALDDDHTNLSGRLSKRRVEEYFRLERPYLNPDFQLTDLAAAMGVNRSVMSAFINRTFGMNFKSYINNWRLAEYKKLISLPANELKNPYKVLLMAGFRDPRHYIRVVKQQEKEYELQS